MVTWLSVPIGTWLLGDGERMVVCGATVLAVNERETTGDMPPELSTARMTNVCALVEMMYCPMGDSGLGGISAGRVSVSACSVVVVQVVSGVSGGSMA